MGIRERKYRWRITKEEKEVLFTKVLLLSEPITCPPNVDSIIEVGTTLETLTAVSFNAIVAKGGLADQFFKWVEKNRSD